MKGNMRKALFTALFIFTLGFGMGQDKYEITSDDYGNAEVQMADTFRKEGKIYVVVGVTLLILAGLFAFTVSTDRKISRLERMVENTPEQNS
jgi:hypothetical protein